MTKLFTPYFHTAQKWSLTLNKDRNCYWNVVEIVRRNHLRSRWLLVATKESPLSFPKAGFPLAFVFWNGLLPHRKSATQNCVLQNLFDLFERFFWNQLHAVLQKFCFATRQLWKCHCNYHAIPVPFDFAWKLHPVLSPQNKRLCVATAAAGKIFCSVTSAEFFSAMASHKMGSWLQRLRRVANELGGGHSTCGRSFVSPSSQIIGLCLVQNAESIIPNFLIFQTLAPYFFQYVWSCSKIVNPRAV